MAYKCTFMDSEVYSAEDVNRAISHITSEGVSLFAPNGNTLVDLNTAISNAVTQGVVTAPDSCRVIKTDGVYKICDGVCFMEDGSQIEIYGGGEVIEPPGDTECYVCFKRRTGLNTITVEFCEEDDGEGVLLAKIGADGSVSDLREYAKCRVRPCSGNVKQERTVEFRYSGGNKTIELISGDFSCVCVKELREGNGTVLVPRRRNLFFLEEGEEAHMEFARAVNANYVRAINFTKNGKYVTMEFEDFINGSDYEIELFFV